MNSRPASFALTYGGAAWLVVLGVLLVWIYLKNTSTQAFADLPALPTFQLQTAEADAEATYLRKAEVAFASGRVTRPKGDSAIDYYHSHLSVFPEDKQALEGVEKVVTYLVNAAERAVRANDWDTAEELANEILQASENHVAALSIIDRANRNDNIGKLLETARSQFSDGQLTKPVGSNALATYQSILRLDPDQADAKQGVEMVAQRLAALAQAEVFAGRIETARDLVAKARVISPESPGIASAEQVIREWNSIASDQAVQKNLQAAALATQAQRLIGSEQKLGALDYFKDALRENPQSQAAQIGFENTLDMVIDRAWTELRRENLAQASAYIIAAEGAGASVAEAKSELAFLERLHRTRKGVFNAEDFVAVSQLSVKRQIQPEMKSNIAGGSVVLQFTVDEEGLVQDIEVVSAGSGALAEAATEALSRWRFEPHTVNGRSIPVRSGVKLRIET